MRIYDTHKKTLTQVEKPEKEKINVYVCGPTVYDRTHIGNARSAIVFDTLIRVLRDEHGEDAVKYVRNLTDVDDKINDRARLRDVSIREITEETTRWFHEDMSELGVMQPDVEPRATENIDNMIAMIQKIIENGHAYVQEGHVMFDVRSDPEAGKLFRAGMEGAVSDEDNGSWKRSPEDFVLWKPSTDDLPGWDSPWGVGRPGWHIECSAMLRDAFGPRGADIHGGGADLQFPHHENEAAQHRCAHPEEPFVRAWMHNAMVMVDGKKMSKSLGNFVTTRELLDKGVSGAAIRLAMLSAHYSRPLSWSDSLIRAARKTVKQWAEKTKGVEPVSDEVFVHKLRSDLSTPEALARMFALEREGRFGELLGAMSLLGITDASPEKTMSVSDEKREEIEGLIKARDAARTDKDFKRSDEIREELRLMGVAVKDGKGGTEWEYISEGASEEFEI